MTEDPKIEEARLRLTNLAIKLQMWFGPAETAGMLLAAGFNCMQSEHGKAKAITYLRELADELEADESDPPTVGRA